MNNVGEMSEIHFTKSGVYRFTTKAGEDYTKGIRPRARTTSSR